MPTCHVKGSCTTMGTWLWGLSKTGLQLTSTQNVKNSFFLKKKNIQGGRIDTNRYLKYCIVFVVLDEFDQHYQATVNFCLTSTINKSQ